jgi:hypothetical protein
MMRAAARMKPGSAELNALVDRTERVIRKATVIEGRGAEETMRQSQ